LSYIVFDIAETNMDLQDATNITKTSERGLLDLSVALSTRDITAGEQFSIFVLIRSPFDNPVWIRQVHVSLPSELELAGLSGQKDHLKEKEHAEKNQREREQKRAHLVSEVSILNKKIDNLLARKDINQDEKKSIELGLRQLNEELRKLDENASTQIHFEGDASFGNFRVVSNDSRIHFQQEASIGKIEVFDSESFQKFSAQAKTVRLESSLPEHIALQPGSTAVYTATFNVKNSIIFTPSQYRLQFNVNYSFQPEKSSDDFESRSNRDEVFTNTVSHEISIRPSLFSVILGAAIGGLVGSIARLLQITHSNKTPLELPVSVVGVLISVMLSSISVIFIARKSESQSFISVEDFWGALLIGFFVGYTGASFFEQVTGATNPTFTNPNPKFSP
jgi:hypothetical protein